MKLETLEPVWAGQTVIVAATGPSLTPDIAARCAIAPTVAVQDAYRLMPWADVLYGCDASWWRVHKGCPGFAGEKWSSHDSGSNDKLATARQYGLRLVAGAAGNEFSRDPGVLRYGSNSGFQAVNFTLLRGAARVVLVGFDMHGAHFFGAHPTPLRNTADRRTFIKAFSAASKVLPPGVSIVNATPGSALRCFPILPLAEAIA